jgi:Beta-lactamase superfamily domain
VRHLFFTHHHSDHNMEYAGFALSSWMFGRPDLRVFGPAGTVELTRTLFGQLHAVEIAYRAAHKLYPPAGIDIAVQDIEEGRVYGTDTWTVTAARVKHFVGLPCYGYRVEAGRRAIAISGDTTYCEAVVNLARGPTSSSTIASRSRLNIGSQSTTWWPIIRAHRDKQGAWRARQVSTPWCLRTSSQIPTRPGSGQMPELSSAVES